MNLSSDLIKHATPAEFYSLSQTANLGVNKSFSGLSLNSFLPDAFLSNLGNFSSPLIEYSPSVSVILFEFKFLLSSTLLSSLLSSKLLSSILLSSSLAKGLLEKFS